MKKFALTQTLKQQFPLAPILIFFLSLFISPTALAHPFASPPTLPAQQSCTLRIVVINNCFGNVIDLSQATTSATPNNVYTASLGNTLTIAIDSASPYVFGGGIGVLLEPLGFNGSTTLILLCNDPSTGLNAPSILQGCSQFLSSNGKALNVPLPAPGTFGANTLLNGTTSSYQLFTLSGVRGNSNHADARSSIKFTITQPSTGGGGGTGGGRTTPGLAQTFTRQLRAGWNLVSSPVEMVKTVSNFSGCMVLDRNGAQRNVVYHWNNNSNQYNETSVITTNAGVFIRVQSACTLQVSGIDQGASPRFPSGWFIVSTRNQTWAQARGVCASRPLFTDWNGAGYRQVDPNNEVLNDFNGYWVFIQPTCQSSTQGFGPHPEFNTNLTISPPAPPTSEAEGEDEDKPQPKNAVPVIEALAGPVAMERREFSQSVLYFADSDQNVSRIMVEAMNFSKEQFDWFVKLTPFSFDEINESGMISFLQLCNLPDNVLFAEPKVKFYVEDKSGNRSQAFEFSWTCGEGKFERARLASAQPLTIQPMAGGQLNIRINDLSIEQVQLDIFNTAGERVFSGTSQGQGLSFQGLNNDGQRLANGTYFYLVTLKKANGQTERLDIKRMVVLN